MRDLKVRKRRTGYFIFGCLTLTMVFLITTELLFAQPGLPSAPEQTPIDGGLGILAALGGTYAIKKLRDRKE